MRRAAARRMHLRIHFSNSQNFKEQVASSPHERSDMRELAKTRISLRASGLRSLRSLNLEAKNVFAPRTIKTSVHASRRDAPESLKELSAHGPGEAHKGVRDAGCLMHPQPRAQKRVARPHTSIHSGGTGKPGNPARDGLRCMPCSPRGDALLRPSSADEGFVRPGWAD